MELSGKTVRALAGLIAFALLGAWALFKPSALAGVWAGVVSILTPFALGGAVAFVVNLLLRPMERAWEKLPGARRRRRLAALKRPVCLALSVVVIVGVVFVMLFVVIPEVVRTLTLVAEGLPQYGARLQAWWSVLTAWLARYNIEVPPLDLRLENIRPVLTDWLAGWGPEVLLQTLGFTTSFVSGVFNVVVGVVLALYILSDKERLVRQGRQVLQAFLPEERAKAVLDVAALTDATFSRFVTGQLTDAFIVGVLCYVGMLLLRIPYAGAVSVVVGATTVIPVIGVLIGTAASALLIVVAEPVKALWFIVFIVVLQQFESNVVYPKVVGKSVGLPGLWVLAAITVGGATFGVLGMLLSVPVFSVLHRLLREAVRRRLSAKDGGVSA